MSEPPDVRALTGSLLDFARPTGSNLLTRTHAFEEWRSTRSRAGTWPYSRVLQSAPASHMTIADERGHAHEGISLACQDYLGLTAHPAIREAASKALADFGPHSAGSAALAGNTTLSIALEQALGEALGSEHIVLFPTGWAAGYASIAGLVRPDDHVLLDELAHACLQQGAQAATQNVHRHGHLNVAMARERLRRIRAEDATNAILVVTEGLFSMDSDVPDIAALQETCREFDAVLLIDIAHDFGALGPQGGGSLAVQQLLGKVDLVMGSFSKTFSSNGGFLATHSPAVRQYMKFYGNPQMFSNAMSPVQSAVVLEALRIVRSPEGERLRAALLGNAETLRGELAKNGISCLGSPSAIVPASIGNEAVARLAWGNATERGVHINLVEFPAVAPGAARFRMQLGAGHRPEQLVDAAVVVSESIANAWKTWKGMSVPATPSAGAAAPPGNYGAVARALPSIKPVDFTKLVSHARTENRAAGDVLIQAGHQLDSLYFVKKGQVRVEIQHDGKPLMIAECGPGQVVGELSLVDQRVASASVVAVTEVEIACLDRAAIERVVAADPALGMRFYRSLAMVLGERLRHQNVPRTPYQFIG